MKNFIVCLLITLTLSNAFANESMSGWECTAYLDTYTAYSKVDFSYEQASDNDWSWLSQNEAIEDAFDEISSDSVYNECAFNVLKEKYAEQKITVPSGLFWTTDMDYYVIDGFLTTEIITVGATDVVITKTSLTKDQITKARELFESIYKTQECYVDGDCRKIRFCAYTCSKY